MRTVLFILILLPFLGFAQNDCKIKSQKDIYTKEIKLSTGFLPLQGGLVSIQANKTEIDFLFSIPGGKCFDDASTASIIFDSTRVKGNQKNGGTMNCDGLFHFIFRNTPTTQSALQNLATKKVLSIRFKDNSKKETEITLSPEQREKLSKMVSCIIAEAKTIL